MQRKNASSLLFKMPFLINKFIHQAKYKKKFLLNKKQQNFYVFIDNYSVQFVSNNLINNIFLKLKLKNVGQTYSNSSIYVDYTISSVEIATTNFFEPINAQAKKKQYFVFQNRCIGRQILIKKKSKKNNIEVSKENFYYRDKQVCLNYIKKFLIKNYG